MVGCNSTVVGITFGAMAGGNRAVRAAFDGHEPNRAVTAINLNLISARHPVVVSTLRQRVTLVSRLLLNSYRHGFARYVYSLQKRVNGFDIPLAHHSDVELVLTFVQVSHHHPFLIP